MSGSAKGRVPDDHEAAPYWTRSREPLQILVFVLPLVLIYEIGLFVIARGGGEVPRLLAYRSVEEAFEAMGLAAVGTALPAILVLLALLAWQVLSKKPWRLHWPTSLVMAAESLALAVPILLFATLLVGGAAPPPARRNPREASRTSRRR